MRIGAGRDDGGRGGGHASEDGGAGAVRGRHVARASRRIVASARRDRRPQAAVPAGCSRLAVRTGAAAPHLRSGSRSAAPRGSPALPVRAGRLRRGGPRTACDHRLRRPTVPRAAPGAEPDQAEARAGRRPEHSTEDNEAPPFARSNARGMRLDRGRCALQSYLVPSAATAAVERFGSGGATGPLATAPETCPRRRPTGSPPHRARAGIEHLALRQRGSSTALRPARSRARAVTDLRGFRLKPQLPRSGTNGPPCSSHTSTSGSMSADQIRLAARPPPTLAPRHLNSGPDHEFIRCLDQPPARAPVRDDGVRRLRRLRHRRRFRRAARHREP